MVDFSHLPSLIQKRVVEVTNEAALEAPGIAREMSRRGRERSEKESMKNKKLKETRGQVHSQSEPCEEASYHGRDPRRRARLPGY